MNIFNFTEQKDNDKEYKYKVLVYPNITYQKDLEKDLANSEKYDCSSLVLLRYLPSIGEIAVRGVCIFVCFNLMAIYIF